MSAVVERKTLGADEIANWPVSGLTVTRKPPSFTKVPRAVPPNSVPSQANWMLLRPPEGGLPPASKMGATKAAAPFPGLIV